MSPRKVDAPVVPTPLRARGKTLYELLAPATADVAQKALALEAARMADRLDQLNEVIAGKGVLELMHFRVRHAVNEEGVVSVELTVDGALAEARQLASAFERVLRAAKAGVDLAGAKSGGGSVADELRARRESGQRGKRAASTSARGRSAPASS